jgi:hypothetical protein
MSSIKGKVDCNHRVGDPLVAFVQDRCPRCLGRGWYGGLALDRSGKLIGLQSTDKLRQQVLKILTEDRRLSGYGFDYSVLTDIIDAETVSRVKTEIIRCADYLIQLQRRRKQRGISYPPSEEIRSIKNIKAVQNPTEPRELIVTLSVISVSGAKFDTEVSLRRR